MKCQGKYNCYPNCEECSRYMDDCDGSEKMQEEEARQAAEWLKRREE